MREGSREPAAGNVVSLSKKHSEHALTMPEPKNMHSQIFGKHQSIGASLRLRGGRLGLLRKSLAHWQSQPPSTGSKAFAKQKAPRE